MLAEQLLHCIIMFKLIHALLLLISTRFSLMLIAYLIHEISTLLDVHLF